MVFDECLFEAGLREECNRGIARWNKWTCDGGRPASGIHLHQGALDSWEYISVANVNVSTTFFFFRWANWSAVCYTTYGKKTQCSLILEWKCWLLKHLWITPKFPKLRRQPFTSFHLFMNIAFIYIYFFLLSCHWLKEFCFKAQTSYWPYSL